MLRSLWGVAVKASLPVAIGAWCVVGAQLALDSYSTAQKNRKELSHRQSTLDAALKLSHSIWLQTAKNLCQLVTRTVSVDTRKALSEIAAKREQHAIDREEVLNQMLAILTSCVESIALSVLLFSMISARSRLVLSLVSRERYLRAIAPSESGRCATGSDDAPASGSSLPAEESDEPLTQSLLRMAMSSTTSPESAEWRQLAAMVSRQVRVAGAQAIPLPTPEAAGLQGSDPVGAPQPPALSLSIESLTQRVTPLQLAHWLQAICTQAVSRVLESFRLASTGPSDSGSPFEGCDMRMRLADEFADLLESPIFQHAIEASVAAMIPAILPALQQDTTVVEEWRGASGSGSSGSSSGSSSLGLVSPGTGPAAATKGNPLSIWLHNISLVPSLLAGAFFQESSTGVSAASTATEPLVDAAFATTWLSRQMD
ncbi:hypothetical protein H696_00764 [Fonticula alba]|uniref:Uncharacterized protein n=1 Tax=Fonticula alba TaxID=691883 RepID=A0A058ZI70_FONAL|nr:hypothetical protein H696_00764 [Fonticula alba]KCV73222.1 hypothetical protein H696_00764 [Fonticula alba]|eukprot:XP_009492923.1 hypothetical protein H696_00764 [Fonticula alba]